MKFISFDIGFKNMAVCIASFNTQLIFHSLNKFDLNFPKKPTSQNIIDITIDFLDHIFHHFIFLDINDPLKVLIECQMTSKMKIIQTTIYSYFKMISKLESFNIDIIFLSPKHKLDLTKNYPLFSSSSHSTNNYKNNKLNSISFATFLLNNNYSYSNLLQIIQNEKKKDDICDAFLMIIFYFEKFYS